jgi:hypothetical protein
MGGIASNPQVQNAINTMPQQPGQVQQPGQSQVPFQSIPGVYPGMGYPAPQQPGQVGQTSLPPGQSPFVGGLNKPFVNAPYQPATNMMSEADFNGFLQRQNEMQAANPNTTFVNPMTTYQDYVNEVNQGQQTIANNAVSAQERARRGIVGFEGPNFTGQPMNPQGSRGTLPYAPTSQEAYNRFLATSKPVQGGSLPSYEQFVQNRLNQPQVLPARPMPGRPMPQFDPRRSGLGALSGLNGVPGNQNPLYFGPGYK